ncbi:hypothetical protein Indivirus_6_38 [Indivirus ILV1]|uniref:Uncharacterized protein n=1 Tax=Indivirus ILV1 TaxID=1977633 RepID=A0A1V0SE43_9VIRU|nr:hypothetical protein Indivirus_6_38 [Indivirus ILV1]
MNIKTENMINNHDSKMDGNVLQEELKNPENNLPEGKQDSQEAIIIAKYGTLKKRNSLLAKEKKKIFDSADYFQELAKIKKKN